MASGPSASKKPSVNLKDLKKLIDMMRKAELTEVDVEQEGIKIKLRKGAAPEMSIPAVAVAPAAVAVAPAAAPAPAPVAAPAPAPAAAPAAAPAPSGVTITAPMVGTFYRAASPEAAPYVSEGTVIEPGKTVCIIEAMKLMNEIKAEVKGKIIKVLVENAQPVEYGQPLFIVEPA
jgi:acetyl-CoA carboxylase biotin carboxyl carrier protein